MNYFLESATSFLKVVKYIYTGLRLNFTQRSNYNNLQWKTHNKKIVGDGRK